MRRYPRHHPQGERRRGINVKNLIMNGYNKLNLYNYLISYYMHQGKNYTQAKKPALKTYLEMLGVRHKKV